MYCTYSFANVSPFLPVHIGSLLAKSRVQVAPIAMEEVGNSTAAPLMHVDVEQTTYSAVNKYSEFSCDRES